MQSSKADLHMCRANELLEECTPKSLNKAHKHILRAQYLGYGTTNESNNPNVSGQSLVERLNSRNNDGNARYSESTKELVYSVRKSYIIKSVQHLLKAAQLCEQVPIKMWPSNSYAPKKDSQRLDDNYFSPSQFRIIPGSCISDLIHDSIANPKRSKDYINITLKKNSKKSTDMFIADSTKRIHRLISQAKTRYQFDNTRFYTETEPLDPNDKPYNLEKDTALELHLRQILIVCLSMFVLCAQHCSECGCIGLEYTNYIDHYNELRKYDKRFAEAAHDIHRLNIIKKEKESKINEQFFRYLHPDVHWENHACVHFRNFNKMLHEFNIEHMAHVGIPERKKAKNGSLFQLPTKTYKFPKFESTVAISSTLALLSCDSCVGTSMKYYYKNDISYVFPAMKEKAFHKYVLCRQGDETYNSSAHWGKTMEDTQKCIDVIHHVAKSMYFVRFFLKGHEGTARGTISYYAPDLNRRHGKGLKEVTHRVSREAIVECKELDIVECKELEPHHPTVLANIKKYEKGAWQRKLLSILGNGRIPEGELNFCEIDTINESDIYNELVQKTKSMFDSDAQSDMQFPLASEAANEIMKHHRNDCTQVQQKLLSDITERILIFGSALYAYGLLDQIESEFSLWTHIKTRIRNVKSQVKKGEWTCT